MLRGGPLLLALPREEAEIVEASVDLVVQLGKEYQTIHVRQIEIADQATELVVERDSKILCRVLAVAVGRLEVVTQRLRQDHGLHNLLSNLAPFRLKIHDPDHLKHNLALPPLGHPLKHQHQRMAVQVQHDLHFLMHLNVGRPCQPIGKDSPHSGFEDWRRTPMRSTEIHFLSNSPGK